MTSVHTEKGKTMSKYYKVEDVQELITACMWRMTLAKERHGEGFVDYSKQVLDVDELTKRISDLPTIEPIEENGIFKGINPTIDVSEDAISREWVKGICEAMLDEEMLGHMLGYIEDAPSVVPSCQKNRQVERAEGEWIYTSDRSGYIGNPFEQCSICGVEYEQAPFNYCPNCGAKMKGTDDESVDSN